MSEHHKNRKDASPPRMFNLSFSQYLLAVWYGDVWSLHHLHLLLQGTK